MSRSHHFDLCSAPARLMVAGEHDQLDPRLVEMAAIDSAYSITIVAVTAPHPLLARLAPFTGVVTLQTLDTSAVAAASDAARLAAAWLPANFTVRHCAARCWKEAVQMAEGYERLVVIVPPRRRRDRRALARATFGTSATILPGQSKSARGQASA